MVEKSAIINIDLIPIYELRHYRIYVTLYFKYIIYNDRYSQGYIQLWSNNLLGDVWSQLL